ncbi:YafY family protein [Neobacillus niacini]|uniref:helix-turn-helix transcriptional regulator n=1 Tax=Neobacillus niacini TaxID=86668 RepID=UPI0021CAFACC|nr:WYL domain-containing protein [Neobacillus niacini]MCM3763827.1 WYL domain-containing protein [Neobacillus niacini]
MKAVSVIRLQNENERLVLKGVPDPDVFWVELYDRIDGSLLEKSDEEMEWEGAVKLLESYKWTTYETTYVEPGFTEKIIEARNRKIHPQHRMLSLYKRLLQGEDIVKSKAAREFRIGDEQIGRDIRKLRTFFASSDQTVDYDAADQVYRLSSLEGEALTKAEILAVMLILYAARGLNKEEVKSIEEKLLPFLSKEEQRQVRRFLHSYHFHYKPIATDESLTYIRTVYDAILRKRILSFHYEKHGTSQHREVIPYSLSFHNGLFYLLAKKKDAPYSDPVSWRFDRIKDLEVTPQRFRLEEPHIEVGGQVNRSFQMFSGPPQTVKLRVAEGILEYLYRAFPLVHQPSPSREGWVDVEVEVNGYDGIMFWILQQAEHVEVLAPQELRQRVSEKIAKMYELYAKRQPLA